MSKSLLAASLLAVFTTAVHIVAGGKDVVAPLLASPLAETPKLTQYAVWHLVSVVLALSSVALFFAAIRRYAAAARPMVWFISALWIGFGFVFLLVAATQPGEGLFFRLPQWILLFPVGILGVTANLCASRCGKK